MEISLFKVLVCDDSILIRKKLRDCLIENGCTEIIEALDGEMAVNLYKQHQPHLVFMDIVMPIKSGIEAVREICEYDKNAKIVMASSSGTKTHLKNALEAGAYEFIQKPFNPELIKNILLNLQKEI